jgi:cysteinyl-tRNA synthetase
MKDKYQFSRNKPDDKRRKPERRKKRVTIEDAVANFLQKITPLIRQFNDDMEDTESRIADAIERKVEAELRTTEALYEIIKMAKEQSVYRDRGKHKRKTPKALKEHHKRILEIILKNRSKGETFEQISDYLRKENIPTLSGRGKWHAQTVHRLYEDNVLSKED